MKIKAFITHKEHERFNDCQDRFSVNKDTKSIALADGMSQSIFQKIWAQMLVENYTTIEQWEPTIDSVRELGPIWHEQVMAMIPSLMPAAQRRSRNSLAKGMSAGSTFVGIRFNEKKWEGWVLGDSCLIIVDKDNKIVRIETSQIGQFDSHPDYFDSNPNKEGKGHPKTISGELHKEEKLLLVSDPFSDILYVKQDTDEINILVSELLALNNHDAFETLVTEWREKGMHNDDSTLVIVEYDDNNDFQIVCEDHINEFIEAEKLQEESLVLPSYTNAENLKDEIVHKAKTEEDSINEECKTLKDYIMEVSSSFIDKLPRELSPKKKKILKKQLSTLLERALDQFYKLRK